MHIRFRHELEMDVELGLVHLLRAEFHNLWFLKEINIKKSLAKSGHGHQGEIPPAQLHCKFSPKLMAQRPKCCFSTICTDTGVRKRVRKPKPGVTADS